MTICRACDAEVPPGQNFCQECGESIDFGSSLDLALDKTISTGPPDLVERAEASRGRTISSGTSHEVDRVSGTLDICPACDGEMVPGETICPTCGHGGTRVEDRDSLLGVTIAENYQIESVLGEGAMGRVYRARQLSLDKIVAVKVLHMHLAGDRAVARRFHREARAASRLNHPNSLHIIDFGQTPDGTLYIAMEYIEGDDLHQLIRTDFPLPIDRIVNLMGQVCLALDEAHAAGIVHRDLKPENIMVVRRRDGQEQVKVCDFGIAKIQNPGDSDVSAPITVAGIVCGTPEYMSPEQCRGEELDGRADLYSAGVILYQLTTNSLPFVADSPLGVVTRQLTDEAVRPTLIQPKMVVTQAFENVVLKALAKDRDRRYDTALELKGDLDKVLEGEPISPPPTTQELEQQSAAPSKHRAAGRRSTRWPVVVGASLSAGVAAFLAVWFLVPGLGGGAESAGADRLQPVPDGEGTTIARADAGSALEASAALISDSKVIPTLGTGHGDAAPAADGSADGGSASIDAQAKTADADQTAPATHRRRRPDRRRPKKLTKAPEPPPEQPPTKSSFELGRESFRAGNISTAIRHFEAARSTNPGNANVHRMLGKCYYRVGQTERGRSSYQRYLQLRPNASDRQFIETIIGN